MLNPSLRALVEAAPLAHLTTLNRDGSPQTTLVWIGLDGDDIVSAHMQRSQKIRNVERDPRVTLSFEAPRTPGAFLAEYATLRCRATVEQGPAADILHRLGKAYVGPDFVFPVPAGTPGNILRYSVEKVGGIGPWAQG